MSIQPLQVAFYQSHLDNNPAPVRLDWEELVEALSSPTFTDCHPCRGHDCAAKFGAAWSPVDITGTRANVNVRAVTAAVLDFDGVSHAQVSEVAPRLEGFEYVIHSTHSNAPPHRYALRLVMPLSAPVPAPQWAAVLRAVIAAFALPIHSEDAGGVDPVCKDLSRLYFLPTSPVGAEPLVERGRGIPLDVQALLQIAGELQVETRAPSTASDDIHESDLPGSAVSDLNELRKRLAQVRYRKARSTDTYDRERYEILDRVLRGLPLADHGQRDNTVNRAATLAAFSLPPRTPALAAVEILRPSMQAMPCEPEGYEYWVSRAVFSYDRAMVRRLERDAKNDSINARLRGRLAGLVRPGSNGAANGHANSAAYAIGAPQPHANGSAHAPAPWQVQPLAAGLVLPFAAPPASTAYIAPADMPIAPAVDWRLSLLPKGDGLLPCGENATLILANAEETKGFLVWDETTKSIQVTGGPFEEVAPEILDVALQDYLQREWSLSIDLTAVGKRLEYVARLNQIDPLAEYLNSLPSKYDGVKRIENFLIDYCHASCVNAAGEDITEHVKRVSKCFFISLVARALKPGCQVDTVLILEGLEGFFKTSLFRVLADKWFCGNAVTLGDKDSLLLAASSWIVEMSELASWRKADSFGMNAFLTQTTDRFRFPYGRVISKCPRRCVFVGTVNPEEGGLFQNVGGIRRRYWPIKVMSKIDIDRVRVDRDQLFAEAVLAYIGGEKWHFDAPAQEVANRQVEERLVESSIEAKVAEWWFGLSPANRPAELQTHTVAERALHCQPGDIIKKALQMEIGSALAQFKDTDGQRSFKKKQLWRGGKPMWFYVPSEEARTAVHAGSLRSVGGTPSTAGATFGRKT